MLGFAVSLDLFDTLLFLFFFTLHADQLGLPIGGLTFRLNNLIGAALLLLLVVRQPIRLLKIERSLLYGLGAVTASIVISLILSNFKGRCLIFLVWWGFTLFTCVWLPYLMVQRMGFAKVFHLYLLSFLAVGVYALSQFLLSCVGVLDPFATQRFSGHFVRPNAFAYEPSFYALYMTPALVIINLHFLLQTGQVSKRVVVAANLFFLVSTSTSAFFAYLVLFGSVLIATFFPRVRTHFPHLRAQLFRFMGIFALFSLAIALVLPGFTKQFFFKFFRADFFAHTSFLFRWMGIVNGWILFKEHLFFGVGLGAFPATLFEAWLQGDQRFLYQIGDRLLFEASPLKAFEPSNVFTEMLASLGLFGLGAFALLFGAYFRAARRAFNSEIFILLLSVIVTLIVLQFNQGLLRTYIWTHFALCFSATILSTKNTLPLNLSGKYAMRWE